MKVKVRIRSLEGGQQRLGWSPLLWILELRDESNDSFSLTFQNKSSVRGKKTAIFTIGVFTSKLFQ